MTITVLTLSFLVPVQAQDEVAGYTGRGRILLGTSTGFSFNTVSIKDVDENILNINVDLQTGFFLKV